MYVCFLKKLIITLFVSKKVFLIVMHHIFMAFWMQNQLFYFYFLHKRVYLLHIFIFLVKILLCTAVRDLLHKRVWEKLLLKNNYISFLLYFWFFVMLLQTDLHKRNCNVVFHSKILIPLSSRYSNLFKKNFGLLKMIITLRWLLHCQRIHFASGHHVSIFFARS